MNLASRLKPYNTPLTLVAGILLLVPTYGYLASAALLAGFYWIGSLISVRKVYTLLPKESRATA